MKRKLAVRIGVLLKERGYQYTMNQRGKSFPGDYDIHYWLPPEGPTTVIGSYSLLSDQHWMDDPVIKVDDLTGLRITPTPPEAPELSCDWILVDIDSGEEVPIGEILRTGPENEEEFEFVGGRPPHKPSSTGRVYVNDVEGRSCEFYPTVFRCLWQKVES